MTLIRKASRGSGIRQWQTASNKPPGDRNPPLHPIGMRRQPDFTGETAQQLKAAHTSIGSELSQRH
jgi:hypothetical protein